MRITIHFFYEDIQYTIQRKRKIRKWIADTAAEEKSIAGEICIIFCDDNYLVKINRKYLKLNTLTDIITFPLMNDPKKISGDIYISLPRVRENAKIFRQRVNDELHRVIIHGVLHLIGFSDKSEEGRAEMRLKEKYYLDKLAEL